MGYTFKSIPSNKGNHGGIRKLNTINFIVIHYTSNDGDTATANGNYFKNNKVGVSAHFFIDDNYVICSVPPENIAWSVGGAKYNDCAKTGGGKLYGKCTNANSISIELCDTKKNGKNDFTEATLANAAQFVKELMKQYNIPVENVIRHFDVNGKPCPKPFVDSEKAWNEFKARLSAKVTTATTTTTSTTTTTTAVKEYKVKITTASLNVRSGASTDYKVVTAVKKDEVYTIVEEKNGWGKLKSGAGWISLSASYVKKI